MDVALQRAKRQDPERYRIETLRAGRSMLTHPMVGDKVRVTSRYRTWIRTVTKVTEKYVHYVVSDSSPYGCVLHIDGVLSKQYWHCYSTYLYEPIV